MILVQVIAQQFQFARERGRAAPNQIGRACWPDPHGPPAIPQRKEFRLVELAVARNIAIARIISAGVVHGIIGPDPVHVAVINIGRPGALMIWVMAVRHDISGIRHRNMAEEEHSLHIGRICVVFGLNHGLNGGQESLCGKHPGG